MKGKIVLEFSSRMKKENIKKHLENEHLLNDFQVCIYCDVKKIKVI
jgi:hypothetical protein